MGDKSSGIPDKVEFKMLDYSNVGGDTVSFKLEDGTIVKVKVGIERVGVATNYRNADGSLHYAVNTSVRLYIIPHDKKFTMPKDQLKVQQDEARDRQHGTPSHIA